jgi:16S rRNA processing protein RimM
LVHARLLTDFPERFARLKMVYLGPDASPYVLESARLLAGEVHLKLGGVDGPEQAARLRDVLVQIPISEAMPLSEGQYYQYQIVGMAVSAIDGEPLGRVVDILSTGGNDVYVVHGEKGEILLPAIAQVVKEVDVAGQRMVVELMDGMRAVITSAAATGS